MALSTRKEPFLFLGERPGFPFQVFRFFSTTAQAAGASVGRFLALAFVQKKSKKLSTIIPVAVCAKCYSSSTASL